MWKDYSETLFRLIFELSLEKKHLDAPLFFMNWIKCEGWNNLDLYEEIPKTDIFWFKNHLNSILEKTNDDRDKNCFSHLYLFLEFIIENNWELRISEN